MKLKAIQLFTFMYCVLDDLWIKTKNNNLSIYLADANPFICDEGSADPALYAAFKKQFGEEKEFDDYGYSFLINYFEKIDKYYGDILSLFKTISKDEYIDKTKSNMMLTYEELKKEHI